MGSHTPLAKNWSGDTPKRWGIREIVNYEDIENRYPYVKMPHHNIPEVVDLDERGKLFDFFRGRIGTQQDRKDRDSWCEDFKKKDVPFIVIKEGREYVLLKERVESMGETEERMRREEL